MNSVDKPNFRVSLLHRHSTTVSIETNPPYPAELGLGLSHRINLICMQAEPMGQYNGKCVKDADNDTMENVSKLLINAITTIEARKKICIDKLKSMWQATSPCNLHTGQEVTFPKLPFTTFRAIIIFGFFRRQTQTTFLHSMWARLVATTMMCSSTPALTAL